MVNYTIFMDTKTILEVFPWWSSDRLHASTAGGTDSISSWGSSTCYEVWPRKKKKEYFFKKKTQSYKDVWSHIN